MVWRYLYMYKALLVVLKDYEFIKRRSLVAKEKIKSSNVGDEQNCDSSCREKILDLILKIDSSRPVAAEKSPPRSEVPHPELYSSSSKIMSFVTRNESCLTHCSLLAAASNS
jgi:hypothetical protein